MKKQTKSKKKHMLLLLLAIGEASLLSCAKTSGCEWVEGDRFLTGTFHYYKNAIKIPVDYLNPQTIMLDVNAYLVKDGDAESYSDTILITKSSVPHEYREEGTKHVMVSLSSTINGAYIPETRQFYKLLCIEERR